RRQVVTNRCPLSGGGTDQWLFLGRKRGPTQLGGGPLCARTGRSDLTCHWIRRARFRRRPGRNCIPTRRDKTYPPIAFQPDHACGIYRENQESRYAFPIFKSAVSKPSLKRSYTGCRRLRASAIRP